VRQQIAELQLLERQLAQVLHRLQTGAPAPHTEGCHCLDSDAPETREPLEHPVPIPWKGETMPASTLEPLTILAPVPFSEHTSAGNRACGCGCGCETALIQLALPQNGIRPTGDQESTLPPQS
jgi:hypothetical protein